MAVEFEEDGTLLMNGQRVLQEDYDENYEPTYEDIRDYCKIIGLDYEKEQSLVHIAVEALKAPLPRDWKPIESEDGDIYYFNFRTKESSWEHPCDSFYKEMLEREREKIRVSSGPPRTAEKGQKGIDLLPGAAGMLKAGGGRLHNLPPLMSKSTAEGSGGGKLAPVTATLLSQAPGPLTSTSPPQSSYLKSGAGDRWRQPAGSVLPRGGGASLSPGSESAESASPGLAYLKSPVQQPDSAKPLFGIMGSRSPASFQLGNIAAQFEEEEEGSEDSPTEDEEVSDFEKKFHLEGIDAEESSDHEVSEEIARVTGRDTGKEENPAAVEGGGSSSAQEDEDPLLQMKAYADRLDRMSPGALSPSSASPGQHYLKTPQPASQQVGAGGRQSELSSSKSSALGSPRLHRPTSSYGRGGAIRLTTGGGQMVQHHIIPTQTGAAEEEEGEEGSSSSTEHPVHVAHGGLISPPVSTVAPKWSSAKPPSPPESKIPVPQSVGRRSLPQRISPRVDSPDQVESLQLALETQAKVADVKKVHQEELDRLKGIHQKEIEKLQQNFKAELQAKEEELVKERDAALAETRRTLAAEQINEEKQLKAEKEKALEETRRRLQEEEDNEEAELHESKTNRIIKTKQQLDRDQYKEEGELRSAKDAALEELQQEMQDRRATEEDQIRNESEKELAVLRESLQLELEQERHALREAHEKELEREREKGQVELKEKCVTLSQELEVEAAAVALQMNKEKEERLAEMRRKMEGDLETEKENLKEVGEKKEKAEEQLQIELEAALQDRKKVLVAENEAALVELRREYSSKLEQCRVELQEAHTLEVESLKRETAEAEQRLRQLKEQLETEEREHACRVEQMRQECQSLEEEVQEKTARLTAERSQLLEELKKTECERERVGALQAAGAEEAEHLAAQQQRELQEAIAQEKKALAALESSRRKADQGCKQAEEQKRVVESSLSALRDQEEEARLSLCQLKEEMQRDKQQLHQLKSELKKREKQALKKQPKQTAVGVQVDLFLGPAEPATSPLCSPSHRTSPPNFSTPKPALAADLPPPSGVDTTQTITGSTMSGAGQESSGGSPKAATLDYHDLTLTSEPAEKEEYVSERPAMSKRIRPQEPHKDDSFDILHRHLDQEESAYTQAKAVVDKHRLRLAERKQALRWAERELAQDLRKVSKELKDTHQMVLLDGVQASLKEEADSIQELEDQLSTSEQLLAKKKQKLKDIELSLMSNLETSPPTSCSDTSPPVAPNVTSPKTYLRTLQERLSREASLSPKRHTHHRNRAAVKKHLFEPAFMKKANSETESSGVSSTHSLLSSATDSDLELRLPTTTTTTTTQHSGKPSAPSWHTPGSRQPPYGGHMDALTASLQEINGKLWQVLDRLNDQTEFSHLQQLTRQGVPPLAAPTPIYPPTGLSQLVADRPKLPLHSSDRWAQPVLHPQGTGSASSIEDELRARWNGYFNTSSPQALQRSGPPVESIRGSLVPRYTSPPRRDALSTEERLRKEKDWLKEFRRNAALSSSRRSAASGSCLIRLSPAAERPRNVMRFILDEHNNVQLVNQH